MREMTLEERVENIGKLADAALAAAQRVEGRYKAEIGDLYNRMQNLENNWKQYRDIDLIKPPSR